ncbi:MAG: LOG family protein [Gemmataceae bacterium]|nr:LOG family protein [Gemmataceae bacterium]
MTSDDATSGADTVSIGDERAAVDVISQSILGLWEVVNNLTRLRPTNREVYRVTIFGSARIGPGNWVYDAVRDMSRDLAGMGAAIVTGGGPGLMQAANEGAAMAGPEALKRSTGIRVDLPFEQNVNPFVGHSITHRTFFSRLHHFVLVSDAFVVVPGGIGSLLELSMIWQLLQVRKLYDTPLIVVGKMWEELVAWSRKHMLIPGFELASPDDLKIPTCVGSAEETMAILRPHHAGWVQKHK